MKLAVITNPYEVMFETDIINRLFREGLEELHIRKPRMTKDQVIDYIDAIDAEYHNRIVIHSFYSLVKKYPFKGIHLDHDFRKKWYWRWFLNKIILRGMKVKTYGTLHSHKSLYNPNIGAEELILGPVFRKASEHICNPMIKADSLEKALAHKTVKVMGVGGVCLDTIAQFKALGFDSVAVQSAIWKSSHPVQAYIELRDFEMKAKPKLRVVGQM